MFKKKEKKEKSKKHKKQKQQKSVNKPTEKSSNTNPFMSLWNKRPTVFVPKTNQQVFTMLFKDYKENIMRIGDDMYSICFEYTDISFAKADLEDAGAIFLKWVDYLNSFTDKAHIQVTNASTPVNTEKYKQQFIYDEESMVSEQERHLAHEFNTLIDDAIGKKEKYTDYKKVCHNIAESIEL